MQKKNELVSYITKKAFRHFEGDRVSQPLHFLKILVNFLQMLFLVNYGVQIAKVTKLQHILGTLLAPIEAVLFGIKCVAITKFDNSELSSAQMVLLTEQAMQLIFIAFALLLYLVARPCFLRRSQRTIIELGSALNTLFVSIFFLTQPLIFRSSLAFFTPIELAGEKYLLGDLLVPYSQVYSAKNLRVALPILMFQLFVPVLLLTILLFRYKKIRLSEPRSKNTLAFFI